MQNIEIRFSGSVFYGLLSLKPAEWGKLLLWTDLDVIQPDFPWEKIYRRSSTLFFIPENAC